MLKPYEIDTCKTCGCEIAFVSREDGRRFPANVDRSGGVPKIARYERHFCPYSRAQIQEVIAVLKTELKKQEESVAAGDWFDGRDVTRIAIRTWESKLESATW